MLKSGRQRWIYLLMIPLTLVCADALAQRPVTLPGGRLGSFGGMGGGRQGGGDSLERRTGLEDSITISFRYLDSTRLYRLDSSISDFTNRFPVPAHFTFLGNAGNAANSLTFDPMRKPGWDPGFHSFDIYKYNLEESRFYNTTRPYSELGYLLGSKQEQHIHVLHTQNITPNWNFALQYRMLNGPGYFKSQNVNHNTYRLNSIYQSKDRRYTNYFILLANNLKSGENGGLATDQAYLDDPRFKDRFNIPTRLGGDIPYGSSLFSSSVNTGNLYKNFTVFFRQQYDWGKKDSLVVNDTTVIPLFYSKLRIQHTVRYSSYDYRYFDSRATEGFPFYQEYYQFISVPDTLEIKDGWKELQNDISIYQYPDTKNQQQFIKVGATLQNLKGEFDQLNSHYYNISVHGEYRNKTRNQRWDIEANGRLYLAGLNSGDYNALARLKSMISKRLGYLELGFQNLNRTPSFIFNPVSSFNFSGLGADFNKENITHLFGGIEQPLLKLKLAAHYYLVSNYTYFSGPYQPAQESSLFNFLRITAQKNFSFGKYWRLYSDLTVQQKTGDAPVNLPLIFTRQRFAFEGNFFRNLHLSTGLEMRYHTPYKADAYSPVTGQFYFQDQIRIENLPDVAAFFHFRIKSFTCYVRAENLNSVEFMPEFGFTNNNTPAPGYAFPGFQFRLGIFWGFVN
ncbi:MAG TPA: putative porin [Parasegetibacter sp.]